MLASPDSAPAASSLLQRAATAALAGWQWCSTDPRCQLVLHVLGIILCFWLVLEAAFFCVVYFLLVPQLNRTAKPLPYLAERKQFILRILGTVDRLNSYDFKKYVSGFCCGAKFEDVRVDNFCSFLAWAMFNKRLGDLSKQQHDLVYSTFNTSCERHPELRLLKPGFNPKVKHVSMNLNKLPYIHRPLVMYVMVGLCEMLSNLLLLRACGFQCLEINGMSYWYKQTQNVNRHCDSDVRPDPVMFLHGISPGWSFYMGIVRALAQHRDIFLVDLDAIKIKSMKFSMPSPQQYADTVRLILERHRVPTVSLMGHSFGTICANWVIIRYPELVSHLTLIDPVSMLLALPDVAFNFIYRQPANIAQWIIYLGASTELTVCYMLHRQFWWYQNILWLEDIPPHIGVVVGLASNDQICNPHVVQEYVHQCSARRQQLALLQQQQQLLPGFAAPITGILRDDAAAGAQQDAQGEVYATSAPTLAVVCKPAHAAQATSSRSGRRRRRGGRVRQKRSSSRSSDGSSDTSSDSIMGIVGSSRDDEDDVALRRNTGLLQRVSVFTSSMISKYYHNNAAGARVKNRKIRAPRARKTSRAYAQSAATQGDRNDNVDADDVSLSRVSSYSSLALSRISSCSSFGSCASLASLGDRAGGAPVPMPANAATAVEELRRQYGLSAPVSSPRGLSDASVTTPAGVAQSYISAPVNAASFPQKVASIECVMWDGFVHGQVLMVMDTLNTFLQTIFQNEKVSKV